MNKHGKRAKEKRFVTGWRSARWRLMRRPVERYLRVLNVMPISQTDPDDVFIVGYPKSGNTWMRHLIASLVWGVDTELSPAGLVGSIVPDVHAVDYYRRFSTPTYFKSHYLPDPTYRRVIYLARDGRDVLVSYFHHLQQLGRAPDFGDMVREGKLLFPSRWEDHVRQWLNNPFNADMVVVRYEDMLEAPEIQLRKICEFLALDRSDDFLETVATKNDFTNLAAKQKTDGLSGRLPVQLARRGIAGSYRDEFPPDDLREFVARAEPAMQALGYA